MFRKKEREKRKKIVRETQRGKCIYERKRKSKEKWDIHEKRFNQMFYFSLFF